jgi:hypothetical protein
MLMSVIAYFEEHIHNVDTHDLNVKIAWNLSMEVTG